MKTNIVLKSTDRELFGVTIRQETKTGFLNLSDLQDAYTVAKIQNKWVEKRIDHVLNYEANLERIYYLLNERKLIDVSQHTFMENALNKGAIKYLKELKAYKMSGRGENRTIYCDPYIWTLVALELNPQLYAKVVVWLTDKLILNRIEAGNMYKGLTNAMKSKFENPDYPGIAKMLNQIIFGRHEPGIRNLGNQQELKELEDIEKIFASLIDMEFIKTQEQLKEELQKMYIKKFGKSQQLLKLN